MMTLLIVDDEPAVGKGISENIDWPSAGFDTTIVATSGKECMEVCTTYHPAVVLMDIRLPDANGIDLALRIRQDLEPTQVVVLSGHKDFEYAAGALDAGVQSYLTKPISNKKLVEVVGAALAKYKSVRTQKEWREQAEHDIAESLPLLRERVIADWLQRGRIAEETAIRRLAELNLVIEHTALGIVLAVRFDRIAVERSDRSFYLAMRGAVNYLRDRLLGVERTIEFWPDDRVIAVLAMFGTESALASWLHEAPAKVTRFEDYCFDAHGLSSELAFAHYRSIDQLEEAYRQAIARIAESRSFFTRSDAHSLEPSIVDLAPEIMRSSQLLQDLVDGRMIGIRTWLEQALDALSDRSDEWESLAGQLASYLASSVNLARQARGLPARKTDRLIASIENARNAEAASQAIEQALMRGASEIQVAIGSDSMTRAHAAVERAKRFIHEHFQQNIKLDDVANAAFLHSHYLCSVFSDHEGVSPGAYLARYRTERSKALLRIPGATVADVSQRVGYVSPSHFAKVFRNWTGMTPKQYQMQFG
jgi:two-component system, response regulator YesN